VTRATALPPQAGAAATAVPSPAAAAAAAAALLSPRGRGRSRPPPPPSLGATEHDATADGDGPHVGDAPPREANGHGDAPRPAAPPRIGRHPKVVVRAPRGGPTNGHPRDRPRDVAHLRLDVPVVAALEVQGGAAGHDRAVDNLPRDVPAAVAGGGHVQVAPPGTRRTQVHHVRVKGAWQGVGPRPAAGGGDGEARATQGGAAIGGGRERHAPPAGVLEGAGVEGACAIDGRPVVGAVP